MAKNLAEQVNELIPPEKTSQGAKTIRIGDRTFVIEQASTFKTLEAIRLLSRAAGLINLDAIYGEWGAILDQNRMGQLSVYVSALIVKLLPMLADKGPDLLIELAAFLTMTNAELREYYATPNRLAEEVSARKKWLYFDCEPDASLRIVEAYLPSLGLDALKNALQPVLNRIGALMKP